MKKVYLLNDKNQYIGEGIEDFGITYVHKSEVAPEQKFLNGDYDVVWNGEEWEYILIKTEDSSTLEIIPEPTEEELEAQRVEMEKQRQEFLAQQAQDLFPHLWTLFEEKLKELGIIQDKNVGEV